MTNSQNNLTATVVFGLLVLALTLGTVGCAKGDRGDVGATGSVGSQGVAGNDGSTGSVGATGPRGEVGPSGTNGADGQPAQVVALCPGVSTYGTFVEVALRINGKLYAVYSANGGFLTYLAPGAYSSNAIGSACSFTVTADGQVAH